MQSHPNLNALRMFHAASRHLNFRHAAQELNLTQGAVAQQVRRLEQELGVPLFHRKARGLALTEAGRALAIPVGAGLTQIEEGLRQARVDRLSLSLSVTPSFAAKWLLPRLPSFQDLHPEIDLQITADQTVANFRGDGVDLAIRQGPAPDDTALEAVLLALQDLVAVASKDLIARYPDGAPLGTFPLIEDSHRPWARLIDAGEVVPEGRLLKVNQTALALDAARSGQGVALVPEAYLNLDSADVDLRVLRRFPATAGSGFYMVWPRGSGGNATHRKLRDWLAHCFADAS
ncbi:LysR family transcriptional regulator [Sulfitobacter sp. SK012]|uniref:LysR substrate-binding domain-containing protein n=1 Tax=Sulfitobacter sp. SK012 TaxID=1389005 RepID=UPI000E0A2434|nr:LysR substrate-binding domain-containing protein [Sulfitobacter sp. SK012]AXI46550.1 LysR family transcriptional regulator [Sulfitobacter sp. SK012]